MRLFAPAKINLFLRVLSRRKDGYHEIISLVDIISLFDLIEIEEDREICVIEKQGLIKEKENSVFKILELLKKEKKMEGGIRVLIEKGIPIGGGLGGSSTDAAEVLKAVNRIKGLNLSFEEMVSIGKRIGSDIPLFLYGKPCLIKGRGEIIEPFELPPLRYLIVYPSIPLSSKEVYERIVLTKKGNDIKLKEPKDVKEILSILKNDLEEAAISLCPKIKEIKIELEREGALATLLCGSGSSVFAIFDEEERRRQVAESMRRKGLKTFLAESLRRKKKNADHPG